MEITNLKLGMTVYARPTLDGKDMGFDVQGEIVQIPNNELVAIRVVPKRGKAYNYFVKPSDIVKELHNG